jgi:hypothetical protein
MMSITATRSRHLLPGRLARALLAAVSRGASADDTMASKWDIDAAERELEPWRHERLLARRAETYGLDEAQQRTPYEAIAGFIDRAARLGGMPGTSLPWRWGYRWPECR